MRLALIATFALSVLFLPSFAGGGAGEGDEVSASSRLTMHEARSKLLA